MLNKLRKRVNSAHVIALVALFFALGGTAFAITVNSADVENNSLKSIDLKNGKGAKGKDVKDESLTGTDVLDGSLGTADLGNNSVNSAKVADDSLTGTDVDESTLGQVPLANQLGSITVQAEDFSVADGSNAGDTVQCAAGQQALAGGVRSDDTDTDGYVTTSRPGNGTTGTGLPGDGDSINSWRAFVTNLTSAQGGINANTLGATVWVVCAG